MTNEEIYKYADKKLNNQETTVVIKYWILAVIGMAGILLIVVPIDIRNEWFSGLVKIGVVCLLGIPLWYLWYRDMSNWYKIRRDYIYNLVRKDERMRIAVENKLK